MAQPTPYNRQTSFTTVQQQFPTDPLPGDDLDAELNAIKVTLDEILSNLAIIQRDDTALANGSVGPDQLADALKSGIDPDLVAVSAYMQTLMSAASLEELLAALNLEVGVDVMAYDATLHPNLPQVSKSEDYICVASDANGHVYHPLADDNPRTFTIPANSSVAYEIGTTLTFVNEINTVSIAITNDTLVLAGDGSTGTRTLAANGVATAVKVTATRWYISGAGLS